MLEGSEFRGLGPFYTRSCGSWYPTKSKSMLREMRCDHVSERVRERERETGEDLSAACLESGLWSEKEAS